MRGLGKQVGGFKQKKAGGDDGDVATNQAEEKKMAAEAQDLFRWVNKAIGVERTKLDFTDEEKAEHKRIADEYNRQTSIQDARIRQDLATKAWLQQEAIKAIPTEALREAALELDLEPPPMHRPFPFFDTPPIVGFNMNDYVGNRAEDDEENEIVDGEDMDETSAMGSAASERAVGKQE